MIGRSSATEIGVTVVSSGLNRQTALWGCAAGQQSFRELPATAALMAYAEPPNGEGVMLGIPGTVSSSTGVPDAVPGKQVAVLICRLDMNDLRSGGCGPGPRVRAAGD